MKNRFYRRRVLAAVMTVAAGSLIVAETAQAQDQQQEPPRGGERFMRGGPGIGPGGPGGGFGGGFGGPGGPVWRDFGMSTGSMEHLLRPDFQARDMAVLARELELDQSQRPIFQMLLEDYREAFHDAAYELERAIRHRRLRAIEDRMGWANDVPFGERAEVIQLPGNVQRFVLDQPVGRIVFDSSDHNIQHVVNELRSRVEASAPLEIVVQQVTVDRASGQTTVLAAGDTVSTTDGPAVAARENIEIRWRTHDDDDAEARREIPDEVRERMERMRERIRQRMEERLEQQREEMRQRGIDPDEEVEPLEPEQIVELAETFLSEKTKLRQRFRQDAEVLLAPWQRDNLPRAIALITRLNGLQDARLSGEQVDLVRVLDELDILRRDNEHLAEVLHQYGLAFGEAIEGRIRFMEKADISRFLAREHEDWQTQFVLADDEAKRRVAVRSVNDVFTEQIAAVLPTDDDRERFIEAVNARAFPQLAAPTRAQRMTDRLLEHEAIEPPQRDAIATIAAEFSRDLSQHRAEVMRMLRESEPKRQRQALEFTLQMREMRAARREGREFDRSDLRPPMMEEMELWRELARQEREYAQRVRSALPADFVAQITEEDEQLRRLMQSFDRPERRRGGAGAGLGAPGGRGAGARPGGGRGGRPN
jgi:hypothetical protein